MSGAAPLSRELMQQIAQVLPNALIGQGYGLFKFMFRLSRLLVRTGLTETATIALMSPTQKIGTVGSAGQLIPGIVARVVKEDGSLASEGERGELVVTGPAMALRYLDNPEA